MSHFIYDSTALFYPKTDLAGLPAGADPAQFVGALDWNTLSQAVVDVRDVLLGATYFGFTPQLTDPSPAGIGTYFWVRTDNSFMVHLDSGQTVRLVSTARQITTGAGLSGGGTLDSDLVISLVPISPDPTGSYTRVSVNDRGIVTSGGQASLFETYGGGIAGPQVIELDSTRLGLVLRDTVAGVGGALFSVQDDDTTPFFEVTNGGVSIQTLLTVSNKITGLTQATAATDAVAAGRTLTAGAELSGGGDLTADRSIAHAISGVGAGTYNQVTVNTYGHVTGAANQSYVTAAYGLIQGNGTPATQRSILNFSSAFTVADNGGSGRTDIDLVSQFPTTTKGDLPVHNGTTNVRQAVGTNGQVLTADSVQATGLSWTTPVTVTIPTTTKGDLIAHNGTINVRVPVGTNTQVLTADSAQASGLSWVTPSAFSLPTTTKGDLVVYNGTINTRQAVGTNGQVLTADSAQATGLSWTTPSGATLPTTTKGDLIVYDGTTNIRQAVGTNGQVLTAASGQTSGLQWVTPTAVDFSAVPTGAIATPGLGFVGETTTGISRPSAGVLAFSVLTLEKARMDATGVKIPIGIVFDLYNTADQVTDYERGRFSWSTNVLEIATDKGGSGTARDLRLTRSGGMTATLSATGVVFAGGTGNIFVPTTGGYYFTGGSSGFSFITGGASFTDTTGASKFQLNTTGVGFFATAPVAKPTVSGVRDGNAALASTLTGLAALGLITDSTTAGAATFVDPYTPPTGTLRVLGNLTIGAASGAQGIAIYDTADETTNYLRIEEGWDASHNYTIGMAKGGSETFSHNLSIGLSGMYISFDGTNSILYHDATTVRLNRGGVNRYYHNGTVTALLDSAGVERVTVSTTGGTLTGAWTGSAFTCTNYCTVTGGGVIVYLGASSGDSYVGPSTNVPFRLVNNNLERARIDATGLAIITGSGLYAYNTASQATNYERFRVEWAGNICYLGPINLGTGAVREMRVGTTDAGGGQTGIWCAVGGVAASFQLRASNAILMEGNGNQISFFGGAIVVKQTSGANLTNSVTAGGTTDTITDWTNLSTYATDAAAIRNAVYQLAKKLKQINDGLRAYNLFT